MRTTKRGTGLQKDRFQVIHTNSWSATIARQIKKKKFDIA